jgi:hypothetical protein
MGIVQMSLQSIATAEGLHAAAYTLLSQEYVRSSVFRKIKLMRFLDEDAFAPPASRLVGFVGSSMGTKMAFEVRKPLISLLPAAFRADEREVITAPGPVDRCN